MPERGNPRVCLERWQSACRRLGLANGDREYRRVVRAWRGLGRHYHTIDHLDACLRELDAAAALAVECAEVELALWFHDAVYRTWARDNEARSAMWAERFLSAAGTDGGHIIRIREHILATRHTGIPAGADSKLVVDIDLSILGQPPEVYATFEGNVRREYWWVPRKRYVAARREVLASFLARPAIYHWPLFRDRYEVTARQNLERALAILCG